MKNQWSDDLVRVLQNWARWVVQSKGGDMSPFPAYNLALPGKRAGNVIPTLNGEAEEADAIIGAMIHRYQHPLRLNYLWPNTADRVNAKRCSCCLNTYKSRLDMAHQLFAQGWYGRQSVAGYAGSGVRLSAPAPADPAVQKVA